MFPVLYLTLELPKRIINDAIGAQSSTVDVLGFQISQVGFLALLCFAYLVSVVGNGVLKMHVNTLKGVLSERMLRRFRYALIARILRFPQSYFHRTSQGELVSMITAESEQLGGMMGDAISQPVLQAGQMLTILGFLLMQSVWFALAAVALIPLQAWLIPRMQRQINILNRTRVREVRKLASEIGESAAGAVHLRRNGGVRYRLAMISRRLALLYHIRFEIYQKKFFMKFVNNFITQLTPLLFYSFGGYLVIKGELSIGALVAALSAHKDLSQPWNELLNYYNQVQEAALRYTVVIERFAPSGMIEEKKFEDTPTEIPHLGGDLELSDVTLRGPDGTVILRDTSLVIPKAKTVAFAVENEEDRRTIAELLTREIAPVGGAVRIAGQNLADLHQSVIAARIGYASSRPFVIKGNFGANVMAPLMAGPRPLKDTATAQEQEAASKESRAAGNSPDPYEAEWIDPSRADLSTPQEVREWWLDLTEAIDGDRVLFNLALDQKFDPSTDPELASRLVELRPAIASKMERGGFEKAFFRFDRDEYNPALSVAGNLLFAVPREQITPEALVEQKGILSLLHEMKLEGEMVQLSRDVVEMLRQTFGLVGTDHPLFRKLGLDQDVYARAVALLQETGQSGRRELTDPELALLLSVPFQISAEQIGPAFSDEMKARIVRLRNLDPALLKSRSGGLFTPLDENELSPGLTVLENLLFAKLSETSGTRADRLREVVAKELQQADLRRPITQLIYNLPIGLNGAGLPTLLAEALDVMRAAIKRPDVLILDQTLPSYDSSARNAAYARLRTLLPDTTFIYLQSRFADPESYDLFFEVSHAQIVSGAHGPAGGEDNAASADLSRKLRLLETTDLFSGLDRRQLRLLAFGARWFTAPAGTDVFHRNDDPSDGAYLIAEGEAGLYLPEEGGTERLIATAKPGSLVGELGLIRSEPRALGMRTHTDMTALRISAEAFLSVVENDAATAFKLLQVVAGYVAHSSD
ncbi:MAG: ABC transporter ATP-binding protein [Cereibacter sphaeroides]|uniref:ABC transporter ATP-binding protein n=1 Tax=Cereibacter sphaeroides TaxID=1063 RepID=A0A2W5SHQ9_CERSP|nr:MAG: ABC transporter ATP-binding protein [Cereibacter sphaeroides]